jgi:hypothetical protein
VGKLREVETEEDKWGIEEEKRGKLMWMVGKAMVMNRELEKLQEVINELWEELGM